MEGGRDWIGWWPKEEEEKAGLSYTYTYVTTEQSCTESPSPPPPPSFAIHEVLDGDQNMTLVVLGLQIYKIIPASKRFSIVL